MKGHKHTIYKTVYPYNQVPISVIDMERMLEYIDVLNELDTSGTEPMSHVFPVNNVFREDVVTNGDGSEETLANAPVRAGQSFKVPKTIG